MKCRASGLLAVTIISMAGGVWAAPIPLDQFATDPPNAVDVGAVEFSNGLPGVNWVKIYESTEQNDIFLLNLPVLKGHDQLIFGGAGSVLSFDYEFDQGEDSDDTFYATLYNDETGDLLRDTIVSASGAGTVMWLLDDFAGVQLGLEFQLGTWGDIDSHVLISNLDSTGPQAPIPEPASLLLFAAGLLGVSAFSRRQSRLCL